MLRLFFWLFDMKGVRAMAVACDKCIPIESIELLVVRCLVCGHPWSGKVLEVDRPYNFSGLQKLAYHHCQCGAMLVYNPGDGGNAILSENAELVT